MLFCRINSIVRTPFLHSLLIGLVSTLSACAINSPPRSVPFPIVVEAMAKDCDEALRKAKAMAADNVAGTFIHGQRTLIQDNDYSENLNEYTSGVVRRYNIIEESQGHPCRIKIEAWVEPGRAQIDLRGRQEKESVEDLNARVRQLNNNRDFLSKQFRETQDFHVVFSNQEVVGADSKGIRVDMGLAKVNPPPRWREDLESFISIHAKPVIYEPVARTNSWIRFSSGPREELNGRLDPLDFELCFSDRTSPQIRCYTGEQNRKILRALKSAVVELLVVTPNGKTVSRSQPLQVSYYMHMNINQPYRASGYEDRTDFPMVGLSRTITHLGFEYPATQLPVNVTIEGRFRFVDVERF